MILYTALVCTRNSTGKQFHVTISYHEDLICIVDHEPAYRPSVPMPYPSQHEMQFVYLLLTFHKH